MIWERDPSLSHVGTEVMRTQDTRMGACVFGRRRRWRLVKRLVIKERGEHHHVVNLGSAAKAQAREEALRLRKQMSAIAACMARRPFKYTAESAAEFWNLRTASRHSHLLSFVS